MNFKRYQKAKKEKTMQSIARDVKAEYDERMKGATTKLVPHPTIKNTFIEVVVSGGR